MKSFSQFLKEEIDLKGNTGIPDNLTTNADRQARKNLGVEIDSRASEQQIGPQLGRLVSQGMDFMFQGIPPQQIMAMFQGRGPVPQQLEDKYIKLEQLAKKIILDQYSEILDASEKPIVLDIKMLRPGKQVSSEIPEMKDVPSFPSQEEINDPELRKAVDKKKILNVINQGEAKATKNIIKDKSIVEEGFTEIFGNNWETIYNIWLQTTDMANKLDWASPIEIKSKMMKDAQEFMAGSCQVKWEKDEDEEDAQEEAQEEENSYQDEDGTVMTGDQEDFDKITIKAVGIDFPMLIHEAVKGIWSLIKSGAIKEDEELAKLIGQNTSSFEDESQDFRYGVSMQAMFRDFINACKDSDKYSQMRLRVYGKLALDKDRGGDFTDGEFLEITKDIFSTFDLVEEQNLEFVLNEEKFNASFAKRKIEGIISNIVTAEKEYEQELSKWEMDQQFGGSEEEPKYSDEDENDFDDYLSGLGISKSKDTETKEEEEEDDLDTLLDKLSAAKTEEERGAIKKKLDKLTESLSVDGKRIYDIEVERILESTKHHTRRK
jgi:hypothetical protein